jgi:hypothetical protein
MRKLVSDKFVINRLEIQVHFLISLAFNNFHIKVDQLYDNKCYPNWLTGVNWFEFDPTAEKSHGFLARDYEGILLQIA